MNRKQQIITTGIFFLGLIISLIFSGLQSMSFLRIMFGTASLLFIPGRRLCDVFFSKKEIDLLERIALSFALSIAVVPLLVFYANLIGVPISEWLVVGVISSIVVGCLLWHSFYVSKKSVV